MEQRQPGDAVKHKKQQKPPDDALKKAARDATKTLAQTSKGVKEEISRIAEAHGLKQEPRKQEASRFRMLADDLAAPLSGPKSGTAGDLVSRTQLIRPVESSRALTLYAKNYRQVTGRPLRTTDEKLSAGFHLANAKVDVGSFMQHAAKLSGDGPDGNDGWRGPEPIHVEQIGDVAIKGVKGETAREFLEHAARPSLDDLTDKDPATLSDDEKHRLTEDARKTFERMRYTIVARDEAEARDIKKNEGLAAFAKKHPGKLSVVTKKDHAQKDKPHYIRHIGWGRDLFDTDRWLRRGGDFKEGWTTLAIQTDVIRGPGGEPRDVKWFQEKFEKGTLSADDVSPAVLEKIEFQTHEVPRDPRDYFTVSFANGKKVSLGDVIERRTRDIGRDRDLKVIVNTGTIKRIHESLARIPAKGKVHVVAEGILDIAEDVPDRVFNPLDERNHLPPKVQIPLSTWILEDLYKDAGYDVAVKEVSNDDVVGLTKKYLDADERTHKYPLYNIHLTKREDALEPAGTDRPEPARKLEDLIFGGASPASHAADVHGKRESPSPSSAEARTSTTQKDAREELDTLSPKTESGASSPPTTQTTPPSSRQPTPPSGGIRRPPPRPPMPGAVDGQLGGLPGRSMRTAGSRRWPEWPEEDWWDLLDEKTKQLADWWYDNANLRGQNTIMGKVIPLSGKFPKKRKKRLDYEELLDLYSGLELVDVFGEG